MDNYFLDLHKELLEKGQVVNGLCHTVIPPRCFSVLRQFAPDANERKALFRSGYSEVYWGYEFHHAGVDLDTISKEYTPLRQTIVLLCHELLNNQ